MDTVNYKGLSTQEVEIRKDKGLINKFNDKTTQSTLSIIIENVFSYFNFIFTVLAILLILVRSYKNLTFVSVILANTLIGIIHKIRAKRIIDKLKLLNADKAHIIRNGEQQEIYASEVVQDDVVIFSAGEQIYADAVILSGDLLVNEALITGEADDIKKTTDNELLSGSVVTSGNCVAKIIRVGAEAYVNRLYADAKNVGSNRISKMVKIMNKIIFVSSIMIIPISLALIYQQIVVKNIGINKAVTSMAAAAIGMIPDGLYLLTSLALAISSAILAGKNVLVQEMRCLENLARVDVLCVDKTGTITDENMSIENIIASEKYPAQIPVFNDILANLSKVLPKDNATIQALYDYYDNAEFSELKALDIIPFTSKTKLSRVDFDFGIIKFGAPEILLSDNDALNFCNVYASKGYRVLSATMNDNIFLGVVLLSNSIRKNAKEVFDYFKENGVQVKVISGDSPLTVSYIADKVGIENADSYVDMSKISDDEISDIALNNTVFGRTTPWQKKELVESMQRAGKTVAMTGDGVNDILALKSADCSVAMFSGAPAASHVSTMVLMNSDFSDMPKIVMEGRRVVNNIERSAGLFIYKNIFSFLMAILSIIFVNAYPLQPIQVAVIGAFTIGIPGFLLSQEPDYRLVKGDFIKNVLRNAMPKAISVFMVIGIFLRTYSLFEINPNRLSSICALIYAFVALSVIIRVSRPFNKYRSVVFGICFLGLVITLILFGGFIEISGYSLKEMIIICGFGILAQGFYFILNLMYKYTFEKLNFK